jgi:hypothetical protein
MGRTRGVSVLEASGARPVRLAVDREWEVGDYGGLVVDAPGRDRLACAPENLAPTDDGVGH